MEINARFFDGQSSEPNVAVAHFDAEGVRIMSAAGDESLGFWRAADIHLLRNGSGHRPILIERGGLARLRLDVDAAGIAQLRALYPGIARTPLGRGVRWRLVRWIAGSLAAIGVIFFVLLPAMVEVMTNYLPRESERRVGQKLTQSVLDQSALVFDVEAICTDANGLARIAQIYDRLSVAAGIDYPVDFVVLESDLVNAFALPGGQMVILSGLIDESVSAEEIAAVLAHELGHVDLRHPLYATLAALGRSSILSIVLGDISGGVVAAGVAEAMINANYSREFEVEADEYAIELLNAVGVGTEPLADFFDYINDEYGDLTGVWQSFSTHPELVARADRARAANAPIAGQNLGIDQADYEALLNICQTTEPLERGRFMELLERIKDAVPESDAPHRVEIPDAD